MLNNYSNNKLLYYGIGLLLCTIVLYTLTIIFFEHQLNHLSKLNFDSSFTFLFLLAVFLAPIVEEFVFRSILLEKKIYSYFFYLGIAFYILFTGNYYLTILLIIYFYIEKIRKNTNIILYLNSTIFALAHYSLSDFKSVFTIQPIMFQFSLGLILTWIIINFGIVKSILFHSLYNFLIILPVMIALQFPMKSQNTIKVNTTEMTWTKTNYFAKTKITVSEFETDMSGLSIKDFYGSYGSRESIKVHDSLKFYKFHFNIKNKDGKKSDSIKIKNLLYQSKLILKE